ncbi:hypothetical protein LB506_006605 [Fusarium annulatum]|nr:hypothetical protein LB506_006605 [Fusarium annulatum]
MTNLPKLAATAFASLAQDHSISLLFHETTISTCCVHTATSSQTFLISLSKECLRQELTSETLILYHSTMFLTNMAMDFYDH